jgi:hypothetical protein
MLAFEEWFGVFVEYLSYFLSLLMVFLAIKVPVWVVAARKAS